MAARGAISDKAGAAFNAALSAYRVQDLEAAWAGISEAAHLAPHHPNTAFLHAQIAFESWRPSAALYEHAIRLDGGNNDLVRNFILALDAEGENARADALLSGILARNLTWIEGHNVLANMRLTRGDPAPYRSYYEALVTAPNPALRLALFHALSTAQQWEEAREQLSLLESIGEIAKGALAARLFFDAESGGKCVEATLATMAVSDAGLALVHIRHLLRTGAADKAEEVAAAWLNTPHASQFWPYISLCWRLSGDARHGWLMGEAGGFARLISLGLSAGELADLAGFVRALHSAAAPYPEQSVKGGTQTARSLLLHHSPMIGALREKMMDAVAEWRDSLPQDAADGDYPHPFLSQKPAQLHIQGSWSVRLASGGYHRPHTHPKGWCSSAFYLTLPKDESDEDAGKFALGQPPPELGLALAAERLIAPKAGHVVLFPSYSWHATVPFQGEERLTIAFDIAPNPKNKRML